MSAVFRANEAAITSRERAISFFANGFKGKWPRQEVTSYIDHLIKKYGPVVDGYPNWHPFTRQPKGDKNDQMETDPRDFEGLDHTIYFRDAFVTAPYHGADLVIESARKKNEPGMADGFCIQAEEITGVLLYHEKATPVLVTCEVPKEGDGTISKRFAIGSMLSEEVPTYTWGTCGETWEDMRNYILGLPCGSRSSLFVNQETGQALREIFNLLNHHGLFGPMRG
jgi:hypothetical protein